MFHFFENHLCSPKVLLFSGQRVSKTLGSSLRNDTKNKNRPHVNIKAKLIFKNKKSQMLASIFLN